MVGTLIKHEARRTLRWYGLILLAGVVIVGFAYLATVLLPPPLQGFFSVLTFLGTGALIGVVPIWLGIDFYRSSYSKTGYLTRALPVKGSTIYWTKLGFAYVLSLGTILVGLVLGYVATLAFEIAAGGTVEAVNESLRQLLHAIVNEVPLWVTLLILALVLLWPLTWLASYYFAAAVGSEAWASRMGVGGPILVWFLFYAASQIIGLLGALIPLQLFFGNGSPHIGFEMLDFANIEDQQALPLGVFLAMFLLSAVAIVWASVSFDRKAELR
ncbi:MAG: hypothetical protein Q4G35_09105 [Propionibacteriaceae bacterium]|nr:hypothetical protein [Propionibacteriaceae bacterium]